MSLKLHYHPASQPSRAALALLNLGKIKYEKIVVNLFTRENRGPEFITINPFGTVPCLQHGNFSIGQSNAILTYLCDAYPRELEKYAGLTIQEKALVSQFLSWYQGTFRPSLVKIMGMKIQIGMFQGKPIKASDIKEAEAKMRSTLDFLNQYLEKRGPYICGENMTIADLLIFHEATNMEFYQIELAPWKTVNAWYNRMLENEQIAKIHKEFRDGLPATIAALSKVEIIE